jgi:hypothetical protein
MDIAAMSVVLSQSSIQQQASLSVMKMAMGVESTNGDAIAALAGTTVPSAQPYLGANLDTLA